MKKILFAVSVLSSNVFATHSHFYVDALQRWGPGLKTIMRIRGVRMAVQHVPTGCIVGLFAEALSNLRNLCLHRNIAFNKIQFFVAAGGTTAALYLWTHCLYKSQWALNAMFAEAEALRREGDLDNAAAIYELAAIGGHPGAWNAFGFCLLRGDGVAKNEMEAARYLRLAADQGHADAQYGYGYCLLYGKGVPQNAESAVVYLNFAALQNHREAQYQYGLCFRDGVGISQNAPEAARYLGLAAAQDHREAQYEYGLCLCDGVGVQPDAARATHYFRLAADQGHAKAREALQNA